MTSTHEQEGHLSPDDSQSDRTGVPAQAGGNVDKIRDILFGTQMRDYETRFSRLEESLLRESAELRETTRKRFDGLETYIKQELEALHSRLKAEREERSETHRHAANQTKDLHESLLAKIRDLDDQSSRAHHELRNGILEQSKHLNDEISRKQEEISALLERRFQELRHGKTDRSALAAMLSELSLRLNGEFQVPGVEG
jgi:DNA repair exonuclease SbcCD ATPase subunit